MYEIEHFVPPRWLRSCQDDPEDAYLNWVQMCKTIPFALATDCKSVYDVCMKAGSMPDDKRTALDLLDIKQGIAEMSDQIRWIPTDHMLADCLTKEMPPDLLLQYLQNYQYSLKFDEQIASTKRSLQKQRARNKQKSLQ